MYQHRARFFSRLRRDYRRERERIRDVSGMHWISTLLRVTCGAITGGRIRAEY